ncbi:Clr5 domain-containing protein [Hypoxylon rubiginosum]|uniref:Clr5 domain-containing protein n=1 Tax=Hypoxylon rubiginosum TaxID=110542 RepID=A0ACB9Z8R1_9PEZI|nr:Clr5 domain-containing protein [Hypoxylon rubiginosum]
MARHHKTLSKRHGPAKRKAPGTWERYKSILQQLYLEQRLPLSEVMKKMKQDYNFNATQKQYRYRFVKWKWLKYSQKRSQSPDIQSDSSTHLNRIESLEIVECSATSPEDSDQEYGNGITPSSSDSEGAANWNTSSLRRQFLSVFSKVCYPVPDGLRDLITAGLQDPADGENRFKHKDAVIGTLMRTLGLTDGSVNVVAYHHLDYALASLRQIGQERTKAEDGSQEDKPVISRLHVIERQPWYHAFDESSPASRCISSCLDWIKQQLRNRQPKKMALSYFDALGEREAGDGSNTSKQDVCLFVYLVDAWIDDLQSQGAQRPQDRWDQLSEEAVGVSPIETLRTMSSLILGTACMDPQSPPQRRSARNIRRKDGAGDDQLIDSALNGIEAMESTYNKRSLTLEFITEFVWIHDPNRRLDGEESRFEAEARIAAEAYADAKLSVPIEAAYALDGAAFDDAGTLDDASDISMKDSD